MNRTGFVTVLIFLLGAELLRRDGLTPLKTVGQAASGQLVLK